MPYKGPPRPIRNPNSKLTLDQVREIRRRLELGEMGRALAAEYRVHKTVISKLKIGETYRWVDRDDVDDDMTWTTGKPNANAKLSPDQVRDIRERLFMGETARNIAASYSVHETVISKIKHGEHYRWVDPETSARPSK